MLATFTVRAEDGLLNATPRNLNILCIRILMKNTLKKQIIHPSKKHFPSECTWISWYCFFFKLPWCALSLRRIIQTKIGHSKSTRWRCYEWNVERHDGTPSSPLRSMYNEFYGLHNFSFVFEYFNVFGVMFHSLKLAHIRAHINNLPETIA